MKMKLTQLIKLVFFLLGILLPLCTVSANVIFNEIMYDLAEGSDGGREWIEVYNNGAQGVDISGWRLYEAETNHKINLFGDNGSFIIPAGGYAVIADNPSNFLTDWPSFSGTVFDSSFSLNNTGEELAIHDADLNNVDSVFYTSDWGAAGDGNSLQKVGGEWLAAGPTPGAQNSSESAVLPEEETQEQTSAGGDSGWPEYVPPEDRPKISAYAGKDMVLTVGALGEFRGEGYDFEDQPLEKAKYSWNFGDGSLGEGQNISHFYRYPGEYIVTLDVSSGKNSAADRLIAKAVPNKIIISEVKTGPESFAELYNGSKEEINISGWQIRSSSPLQAGYKTFVLPENTFVKPFGYSVFPVFVSGITFPEGGGKVELLYQTGLSADSFEYNGFLAEGRSFSCAISDIPQKRIYIADETPGQVNIKTIVPISTLSSSSNTQGQKEPKNYESEIANYGETNKVPTSTNISVETQEANVVSALGREPETSKTKIYLLAVLGLVVFAGAGVVFLRKPREETREK